MFLCREENIFTSNPLAKKQTPFNAKSFYGNILYITGKQREKKCYPNHRIFKNPKSIERTFQ